MALFLVTGPAIEPLTLAEAKLHCRVDVADDDALIQGLIVSARQYVETYTHRALITQTWDDKRDGWTDADDGAIWLPMPPVTSVTSITYTDSNGDSTVWSSALYTTDLPTGPKARAARIVPAYGESYPSLQSVPNNVVIRFVSGYGSTAASVPESLRSAMKMLILTWYGPGRQTVNNIGTSVTRVPDTVDAVLWPFKVF